MGKGMLYKEPYVEIVKFDEETLTTNLGLSGEGSGDDYKYDF